MRRWLVATLGSTVLALVLPVLGTVRAAPPGFQNQILVSGVFALPTAVKFLPDGKMLVLELGGKIWKVNTSTWDVDPTPFLEITNIGTLNGEQGLMDLVLDPDFASNRFYYVFYTRGTPNRDRTSRFTATADLSGTIAGSEFLIYEDPQDANDEHHGGSLSFANDGKLYITTGEHFDASAAQSLTSPRGKLLRFNKDGTVPADNPFFDGGGPNVDAIWALGLRNPFRSSYDSLTDRLYIGNVGGNDYSTAQEDVNLGARGANYGWPLCEGSSCPGGAPPGIKFPFYSYDHSDALHPLPAGRDACIIGGFVYRGSQFPPEYYGSYFFGDYAQHWIKRLTLDANGNLTGVLNFEPSDGSPDGPYGDIVGLTEGSDGALYYVDIGTGPGSGSIRRIRYVANDLPPTAVASAQPSQGPAPLTVNFSSAGSSDPEGDPLTFAWTFGDGGTSTLANPVHTYISNGPYSVRLTVSDGTVSSFTTITVRVGNPPVPTIVAPADGGLFRAGQVVPFSGTAVDPEDGAIPASGLTWNIDFLHEGHVHPGLPQVGVSSGTFTVPTTGHDFHGFTRYRFTLTATDLDGLQGSTSVTIFPDKVNLSFDSAPRAFALTLDGISHVTPFVYDTLKGFLHAVGAPDHPGSPVGYAFDSWSDGGARDHTLVVPDASASFLATYKRMVRFNSLTPCRLIDTRLAVGPEAGSPALAGAEVRTVDVAGKCGLPPSASSLSVNVTITNPQDAGFLTIYAADLPSPPLASSINFRVGETRANNAVIRLATNGTGLKVVNGSNGSVDLIIDVNGWFE